MESRVMDTDVRKLEIYLDSGSSDMLDAYMVCRLENIIERVAATAVTPDDMVLIEACHRVINYLHEV